MKKILRLVTTSVLTLTLVACGEASSSVSNGTNTSSSVSSTTSAFANVSTITLSAASDVLTQTMGTQKAVVVQAALNANTNPSLALEWFVNGTKSNQTGRVFEYTPAAAGTFEIQAKSGSVLSNKINVTVGAAALVITGDVKVVANNKIEITAPGGATVAVTNNEVLATSFYDLAKGIYVIDLKTALSQGATSTVTLTRAGLAPVSRAFTFDTRKLEIDSLSGLKAEADGSFKITKPHALVVASGTLNNTIDTYTIAFKATNLGGTAPLAFSYSRIAAPVGAEAFVNQTGLRTVDAGADKSAGSFTFNVTRETPAGTYSYKYVVGDKESTVNVIIENTKSTIDFVSVESGVNLDSATGKLPAATYKYPLTFTNAVGNVVNGVAPLADGSFVIEKPYLTGNNNRLTFTFSVDLKNFLVPEALLVQPTSAPNQLMVTLAGPDGLALMRTGTGVTQTALPAPRPFRVQELAYPITQVLDASTPAGKYKYTVKVLQLGVEIMTKDVVVELKNPQPKLSLIADEFKFVDLFNTAKTAYETTTLGTYNTSVFGAASTDFDTLTASGVVFTNAGNTDVLAASPVAANVTHYGTLKTKYLTSLQTKVLPYYSHFESSSVQAYDSAKQAWVNAFIVENPFVNTSTNTLRDGFIKGLPKFADLSTDEKAMFAGANDTERAASQSKFNESFAVTVLAAAPFSITLSGLTTAALYRTAVEKLFPAHYDISSVTSSPLSDNLVNARVENGVYIFEKPRATGLDARTLVFDALITNFESPANPAATLASAFNGIGSVRKDLLTFKKTVSGPVNMPNLAGNQIDSLIAIELGTAVADTFALIDDLDPTTALKYYRASTNTSTTVRLDNVFVVDASFLTVTGEYNFSLQVGTLSQQIKVRVVEPAARVNMSVLIRKDDTNTPLVNEANTLVPGNFDFTLGSDGKYYATLLRSNQVASATPQVVAKVNVVLENMVASTDGDVNYSITKVTPLTSNTDSNKIAVIAATGNNGHLVGALTGSPTFVSSLYSLIGGTYTARTAASSVHGVGVANAASTDNTLDFTLLTFTAKGEYSYSLTINGVTSKITLVVQESPTLSVVSAKIGTTDLAKMPADGLYIFEEKDTAPTTTGATSINFGVEGKLLPAGKLFYKVWDSNLYTATSNATGDFFDSAAVNPVAATAAIETGALTIAATDTSVVELKFVDGVANVVAKYDGAKVSNGTLAGLTGTIAKQFKVIAVYKLNPAVRTAVGAVTAASYELVAYHQVVVWTSDINETSN
jgi:hypothetical protein